jgi:copper chaperone CopZ
MDEHCHVEPIDKTASDEEHQDAATTYLVITGMGCRNCAARVHNSLVSVRGVVAAQVDHIWGVAQVQFNPKLTTIPALIQAVARAGGDGRHEYRAQPVEAREP